MKHRRHLTFCSLFFLVCVAISNGQPKPSAEDQEKLDRAQKVAKQFVERFRATLDFGKTWQRFRSSDQTCALYAVLGEFSNVALEEKSLDQRLADMGVNERVLERYHAASWNYWLVSGAYVYSVAPSRGGSEPDIDAVLDGKRSRTLMTKLAKLNKTTKYVKWIDEDESVPEPKPRTRQEMEQAIREMNRFAATFRTHMPRDAMKSAQWKSAVSWFGRVHRMNSIIDGDPLRKCPIDKIYVAQIGHFAFGFVEEKGQMKILTMILITQ